MDAEFHPRLKLTHWAIGFSQPASNLCFELHALLPR
jgi:hypothetical protein